MTKWYAGADFVPSGLYNNTTSGVWSYNANTSSKYFSFNNDWAEGTSRRLNITTGAYVGGDGDVYMSSAVTRTLTRPRSSSTNSTYVAANDSFTISGRTVAASTPLEVSADGGATWTTVGSSTNHTYSGVAVDRKLTSGTELKVREGSSGSGLTAALHGTAVSGAVATEKERKRFLAGKASNNAKIHVSPTDLASDEYQSFTASPNGTFSDVELDHVPQSVRSVTIWQGDNGKRTHVELPLAWGASATSINVKDRTANITGYGKPGATIVLQGKEYLADSDTGEWMASVKGLVVGQNTFTAKQYTNDGDLIEDGDIEFSVEVKTTPLTAELQSTDTASRSAVVTGTGTPGGIVTVKGSVKQFDIDEDGKWSGTVTGLKLGANSVVLQQFVDDKQLNGNQTVAIPLVVSDLTAEHEFGSTISDRVTLKGRSEANAKIVITDAGGHTTITTANSAGAWTTLVDAPGGGKQTFTVVQNVYDMDSAPVELEVDYGATLEVTSPQDGATFAGTNLTFTGTGVRGQEVSVFEGTTRVATGNPIVSGDWEATVRNVAPGAHTYVVKETTRGNLTTSKTITINPGDVAPVQPEVVLTNPANAADGYTPDQAFTFKGTAKAKSTITIRNTQGTLLGQNVPVNDKGEWEWTRANMRTSTYNLDFFASEGTGDEKRATLRDFKPNAAPAPVVTLTNPTNASDGYTPNTAFTFKGTGTSGHSITIRNTQGTILGQNVPVNNKGEWEWTRATMRTSTYNLDFIQDVGTANEKKATLRNFAPNATPAPVVTVTNPANPADGYAANTSFTFRGKATPNTTITIVNSKGTVIAKDLPVNASGDWSWTRTNMGTSIWKLTFVQNLGGTDEHRTTLGDFAPRP